jgi:hypothetical protein
MCEEQYIIAIFIAAAASFIIWGVYDIIRGIRESKKEEAVRQRERDLREAIKKTPGADRTYRIAEENGDYTIEVLCGDGIWRACNYDGLPIFTQRIYIAEYGKLKHARERVETFKKGVIIHKIN